MLKFSLAAGGNVALLPRASFTGSLLASIVLSTNRKKKHQNRKFIEEHAVKDEFYYCRPNWPRPAQKANLESYKLCMKVLQKYKSLNRVEFQTGPVIKVSKSVNRCQREKKFADVGMI